MKYKSLLLIVVIGFFACSNPQDSKEAETEQKEVNKPTTESSIEQLKQEQVGYLKLSQEEIEAMHPDMQSLYASIIQNTNYASGISVSNILIEVNDNINRLMQSDTGAVFEDQVVQSLQMMRGNQRMASKYFNMSGRWILRKAYDLQKAEYPSLSGQISILKNNLGEVRTQDRLIGQEKKVRAFVDQCFVVLYLMEEKNKEKASREEEVTSSE